LYGFAKWGGLFDIKAIVAMYYFMCILVPKSAIAAKDKNRHRVRGWSDEPLDTFL
jgi:hypothetical protein